VWLPLRLVLEFLGRSAAWLAVLAAMGALAGLLAALISRRPLRSAWPYLMTAGVLGGLLGASLADRFSVPEGFTFEIWRRPVPLAWSAGGALLGAAATALILALRARQRADREPSPPPG